MTYETIVLAAAKVAKVSGTILLAICTHESGLKNITTQHDGGSPSIGICQVKYETAKMLGFTGEASGLENPKTNAKWAAEYLKYQYERYDHNWHKTISAYNAGSYNESNIVPGCAKNRKYVNAVKKHLDKNFQEMVKCEGAQKQKIYLAKDSAD